MYRPELYHRDDAELGRAREAAATLLYGTGEITRERMAYGVAAWSIVHGLATLWLNGNLPAQLGDDPEEITRVVAAHLDPPRRDRALADNRVRPSAAASQTARTGRKAHVVRQGRGGNSGRIEIYYEDHGRGRRRRARSASHRRPASVTCGCRNPASPGQMLYCAVGGAPAGAGE
jgi:hypothetical protein